MKTCKKCGSEMKDEAMFCTECGEKLEEATVQTKENETLDKIKSVIQNKKMMTMIALCVFLAIIIIVFAVNAKKTVKVMDYCTVEFSGGDGHATAEVDIDYDALEDKICEMKNLSVDGMGYWTIVEEIEEEDSIKVSVSPNENLSNGDKVELKVEVKNPKAIRDVNLAEGTKKVKVEGLKKFREITDKDLFRDIEIVYTNYSPYLEVSVENKSKDPFLKTVRYEVENSGEIENGDEFTITASWNESDVHEVIVTGSGKKKVKAEGQAYYLLNEDDVDASILEQIKQKLEEDYNSSYSNLDQGLIEIKDICLADSTNSSFEVNHLYASMKVEPDEYGGDNWFHVTYYDVTIRDGKINLANGYSNPLYNFSDNSEPYDSLVEDAKANYKACYDLLP